MPPSQASDRPIVLSVVDRLLDFSPREKNVEEPVTRAQSVRQHKEAVRRDLEWLLNTRRTADVDVAYGKVRESVYFYGLPDFSALSLTSAQDQQKLLRAVQDALNVFEPRLSGVQVIPLKLEGINTNTLHFRIEGLLRMDPAPEQVFFDTSLELSRGEYEVKEL